MIHIDISLHLPVSAEVLYTILQLLNCEHNYSLFSVWNKLKSNSSCNRFNRQLSHCHICGYNSLTGYAALAVALLNANLSQVSCNCEQIFKFFFKSLTVLHMCIYVLVSYELFVTWVDIYWLYKVTNKWPDF